MHIEMVKVIILWKVYSLDINFVMELKVHRRTHLGKQSLNMERQVMFQWEDYR